jgi:hypothetical protein
LEDKRSCSLSILSHSISISVASGAYPRRPAGTTQKKQAGFGTLEEALPLFLVAQQEQNGRSHAGSREFSKGTQGHRIRLHRHESRWRGVTQSKKIKIFPH